MSGAEVGRRRGAAGRCGAARRPCLLRGLVLLARGPGCGHLLHEALRPERWPMSSWQLPKSSHRFPRDRRGGDYPKDPFILLIAQAPKVRNPNKGLKLSEKETALTLPFTTREIYASFQGHTVPPSGPVVRAANSSGRVRDPPDPQRGRHRRMGSTPLNVGQERNRLWGTQADGQRRNTPSGVERCPHKNRH